MKMLKRPQLKNNFLKIYESLFKHFGPQHWWPGETPMEVIVGAVLTQNTNWGNVEKALDNLRCQNLLDIAGINALSHAKLAALIKPAGYFNVKARRLKNLMNFIASRYQGDLQLMGRAPLEELRKGLLEVNGIGPETADSILLYAFNKPIFVVDAYTKRFLYRHNLIGAQDDYHFVQDLFMKNLISKDPSTRPSGSLRVSPKGKNSPRAQLFNEYHALIVRLGKDFCKPTPRCDECPLNNFRYSIDSRCGRCFRHFPTQKVCLNCLP